MNQNAALAVQLYFLMNSTFPKSHHHPLGQYLAGITTACTLHQRQIPIIHLGDRHAHHAWEKASRLAPPSKPTNLHFCMPAMPAMPSMRLIRALDMGWWHFQRRRLFRRHILPLLAYDDHVLLDIGHCREDILWANRLPLKVDALHALETRQEKRQVQQA